MEKNLKKSKSGVFVILSLIIPIIIFSFILLKDMIYADVFTKTFSDNEGVNLITKISESLNYGSYLYYGVIIIGIIYLSLISIYSIKKIIKYKKENPEDKESLDIIKIIKAFTTKRGVANYFVNASKEALDIRNIVMSFCLTIIITGGLLILTVFMFVESNLFNKVNELNKIATTAQNNEGLKTETVYMSFPYLVYFREMIGTSELVNLGRDTGRVNAISVTPIDSKESIILYLSNEYKFKLAGDPYYNDPKMDEGSKHVKYEVTYIEEINLITSIKRIY